MRRLQVTMVGFLALIGPLAGCLTNETRDEDASTIVPDAADDAGEDIELPDTIEPPDDAGDVVAVCEPMDCGPAPGSNRPCPDGNGSYTWVCERASDGECRWAERGCGERGCYSDSDCNDDEYCTASTECLSDPSCPQCDVCWGHCRPLACSEAECDPAPGAPCEVCEDGSLACPVCVRGDDRVCGWQFERCPDVPAECTETECGPAPGMPCEECADGTFACPECRRNVDGTCGWLFEACTEPPLECAEGACGPPTRMACVSCSDGSESCPVCVAGAEGRCAWAVLPCPEIGCHSDEECPGGHYCTAATECLPDPSCPECEVCWGTCQWLPD